MEHKRHRLVHHDHPPEMMSGYAGSSNSASGVREHGHSGVYDIKPHHHAWFWHGDIGAMHQHTFKKRVDAQNFLTDIRAAKGVLLGEKGVHI